MRGRGAEEESGWDKEARRDGTEWRVGSLCSGPPALQSACYLGLIWADTWAGSGLLFATIGNGGNVLASPLSMEEG
jgi:hypothetical protein